MSIVSLVNSHIHATDYKYVITYKVPGVKTTIRATTVPMPVNGNRYTSIYSMYPHGSKTSYNFEVLLSILNKYKALMKSNNTEENSKQYAKCIEEIEDSPIGLFINHNKELPLVYVGVQSVSVTEKTLFEGPMIIKELYNKIQDTFNELFKFTQTVSAAPVVKASAASTVADTIVAAVTSAVTAVVAAVVPEKPAVAPAVTADVIAATKKPRAKKEDDFSLYEENSADFDPTKWQKPVTDFEATKPVLEEEIKTLEAALAANFDIVTSNRLKKRQRMLAQYPTTLATLKANATSKQNYYTDGLQSNYKTDQASIIVDLNIEYFTPGGHTRLTENFNNTIRIAHLARNPALFLKVETIVKDCRKKVNRLRINKEEKLTWVQNLETVFEALKAEVKKSKYYVNIPEDN